MCTIATNIRKTKREKNKKRHQKGEEEEEEEERKEQWKGLGFRAFLQVDFLMQRRTKKTVQDECFFFAVDSLMQKIPGLGNRSRSAIRFSLWAFHSFKRGKKTG